MYLGFHDILRKFTPLRHSPTSFTIGDALGAVSKKLQKCVYDTSLPVMQRKIHNKPVF